MELYVSSPICSSGSWGGSSIATGKSGTGKLDLAGVHIAAGVREEGGRERRRGREGGKERRREGRRGGGGRERRRERRREGRQDDIATSQTPKRSSKQTHTWMKASMNRAFESNWGLG